MYQFPLIKSVVTLFCFNWQGVNIHLIDGLESTGWQAIVWDLDAEITDALMSLNEQWVKIATSRKCVSERKAPE